MAPTPRPDAPLAAALWFLLEVILFTAAATLVVGVSTLLVAATLSLSASVTDSRTVSSLLALLVFFCYLGVPAYLLATRTDADGDSAGNGVGHSAGNGVGDSAGNDDGDSADGTAREKRE